MKQVPFSQTVLWAGQLRAEMSATMIGPDLVENLYSIGGSVPVIYRGSMALMANHAEHWIRGLKARGFHQCYEEGRSPQCWRQAD